MLLTTVVRCLFYLVFFFIDFLGPFVVYFDVDVVAVSSNFFSLSILLSLAICNVFAFATFFPVFCSGPSFCVNVVVHFYLNLCSSNWITIKIEWKWAIFMPRKDTMQVLWQSNKKTRWVRIRPMKIPCGWDGVISYNGTNLIVSLVWATLLDFLWKIAHSSSITTFGRYFENDIPFIPSSQVYFEEGITDLIRQNLQDIYYLLKSRSDWRSQLGLGHIRHLLSKIVPDWHQISTKYYSINKIYSAMEKLLKVRILD